MRKIFIHDNSIIGNKIQISGQDVNHLKNVLRVNIGDEIETCSKESGINYKVRIIEIESDLITCEILEKKEGIVEGNVLLDIYQGLPKSDKMELIIQKGVELGVSSFIPVKLSRCIVKLDPKDEIKKIDRWNKISEAAAKQSGRDIVPEVRNVLDIKQILDIINDYDLFIVCFEEEKDNSIKNELEYLKNYKDKDENKNNKYRIGALIGPEGGLAKEEVDLLKENGAKVVTLGKRILRTETAPIYISSIIMYELEMN